ncbi:unnamed protein product [Fusarium graminearum]|nr:unnamed protein product [Fusarium graminearum]
MNSMQSFGYAKNPVTFWVCIVKDFQPREKASYGSYTMFLEGLFLSEQDRLRGCLEKSIQCQ